MARQVAPALRALLERSVDYAGMFPPASLSFGETCANYERYLAGGHSWMLNRLVLPVARLRDAAPGEGWRISVLAEEPFELTPFVASVETKSMGQFGVRTYREIEVADVPEIDCWKIRAGGVTAPSSEALAMAIGRCARRHMAFKATAGLHRALRSDAGHGFVNLFVAAAFAWFHRKEDFWHAALDERDPAAFRFDEALHWRDRSLEVDRVRAMRRDFLHAFGSCSFEEPVEDLEGLGWL